MAAIKLTVSIASALARRASLSLKRKECSIIIDDWQTLESRKRMFPFPSHLMPSDSYTSLKLIRQKFLLTKIASLETQDVLSADDEATLQELREELEPITKFLDQAKQQRDSILAEIGA